MPGVRYVSADGPAILSSQTGVLLNSFKSASNVETKCKQWINQVSAWSAHLLAEDVCWLKTSAGIVAGAIVPVPMQTAGFDCSQAVRVGLHPRIQEVRSDRLV